MPTMQTDRTFDTTEIAARLRLGVTRLARKLRQEAEAGLSPSLLSALSTIAREGRLTIGDLCSLEQVQPPTVTRAVAALVEGGLVSRETDGTDRRVAWVSVTPEGAKLLHRTRRRKEAYLARRLRDLSPRQLATLDEAARILEQLVEGRG
jgi:DNA-binding MarR family transcriptional regulator